MRARQRARAGAQGRRPGAQPGRRIPLSSLRARLDAGSAAAEWLLHPDGVLGRALLIDSGQQARFPLRLAAPVTLSTRVMLLPHDWRDGNGAVRATITASRPGQEQTVFDAVLRAGDRGRPRGWGIHATLPADTTALTLSVQHIGPLRTGSVTRAIWLEPALQDPTWTTAPAPPTAPAQHTTPPPVISVLTPVHNPPVEMLEEAIASVQNQTYPHWQLCLIDDGSTNPAITAALQHHAATDPRIQLARHPTAQGISAATNHALQLATGDYIALLDHDDTLTPDALAHIANHIQTDPSLDMLYSDEDILHEGGSTDSHRKPGWSPEHMTSLMYTCHLGVYRRALAAELGGFSSEYDGCQDYDFVLRLSERTDRVAHIPRTLYHWRAHAQSTASGEEAKPLAYVSQPGAITAHLQRLGVEAEVQFAKHAGMHRIVHRVDPGLTVDVALALTSTDGLAELAGSLAAQPHPSWKLTIAAPERLHDAIAGALAAAGLDGGRLKLIGADTTHDPGTAGHEALPLAVAKGEGEHVLLLPSPVLALTPDWLRRLLGYSAQAGIAAAGPVLLAPDGRIQHAGVALPEGLPLHLLHGMTADYAQPVVYNLLALSGALITPRAVYESAGGLDPSLRELGLIDYCLRAAGRKVIVPDTRLRITGADPTSNDLPALHRLSATWAARHTGDPYYNPHFRSDRGDYVRT